MKVSKKSKQLAKDLELEDFDAVFIEIKAKLYKQAAQAIRKSKKSHDEISVLTGTSRTRITRIANLAEQSVSLEMLTKIVYLLQSKMPIKLAG